MRILIGLLSVTGLRSGEAIGLDVSDLDASGLVLTVRGKLGRPRLVPLHSTSADHVAAYLGDRTSGPLFVGGAGGRISRPTVDGAFRRLVSACQIPTQAGGRPPRLHDFRHTLAVDVLVDAHRQGLDVDARVAVLSTFLGHREPASTYWYLTASPELMAAVSDRMAEALRRQPR
jgi:integrase/recombinase XerD